MEDQNIVICISCGAPYKQGELKCPYCQAENRTEAQRRKREKLESYDKEAVEIEKNTVPNFLKKVTKIVMIILGLLFAGLAVAAIVAAISGPFVANRNKAKHEEHLAVMEGLLQEKNYEGLVDYRYELEVGFFARYEKYRQVTDVYECLIRIRDYREFLFMHWTIADEEVIENRYFWAEAIVECALYDLPSTRARLADKVVLGNEAYLEELYNQVQQELYQIGLTWDEIAELSRERETEEEELLAREYSILIYERNFPEQ